MLRAIVVAVVILAAAEPQSPVIGHPLAAPQMLIALGISDKEELVIRDYEIVMIFPAPPRTNKIGAHIPRERSVSLDGVKVVTAAGKELDRTALRERLKKEEAVFAMSWGRAPLDVYRAAMKPESLILIFPKQTPQPESLK
jgi:hypothetical protein